MSARRACLTFHAQLAPLEQRREIVVETVWRFAGDRLVLKPIPRGRLELAGAWARHLVVVAFHNARARVLRIVDKLRTIVDPDDLADGNSRRECWGWRLGPKPPPVVLNAVDVAAISQFPGLGPTPAELFMEQSPPLRFDPAPPGTRISIVVSSLSRKPFLFQAAMFGDVFDGEG